MMSVDDAVGHLLSGITLHKVVIGLRAHEVISGFGGEYKIGGAGRREVFSYIGRLNIWLSHFTESRPEFDEAPVGI